MSGLVSMIRRAFSSGPAASPEAIRSQVESLVSSPVAVFSKSYCPYCMEAKHILKDHGQGERMQVIELDRDTNGSAIQSYLAEMIGASRVTVPQVYIGGKLIGGCNDLKTLKKEGKLEELLAAKA
ncbi:hypothetical protein JCM8547_009395 [Rhodosporidiobolus lusitaniae]